MNNGFIKVAAATPKIKVGDCKHNAVEICSLIREAYRNKTQLIVFPELCITGYTAGDLFWQKALLDNAMKALIETIVPYTEGKEIIAIVGLPMIFKSKLYNMAAVVYDGEIMGFVPKTYIPNYSEFYEGRHFSSGKGVEGFKDVTYKETNENSFLAGSYILKNFKLEAQEEYDNEYDEEYDEEYDDEIDETHDVISVGTNLLFKCVNFDNFTFSIEICEDLWVPNPPSTNHAMAGATVIANLSASDETVGKDTYRTGLVTGQSARTLSAYIYADAGEGESTTDLVFAGHNIIAENGAIIAQSDKFTNGITYGEIDLDKIAAERARITTFVSGQDIDSEYEEIEIYLEEEKFDFSRVIDNAPFVPSNESERDKRCEEILSIQTMGLKKRLEHTNCKNAVVGISGGLDSTLALLVTVRAFDSLNIDRKGIIAVTMPGFGTTDRTYNNALKMIEKLGCTLKEVNIAEAVKLHLKQIGHDINIHDVTYENAQARQRTYLLMDFANEYNGMVIGTGDMSELALGWATYNGDHMSMYGVNAGVPKTLVRHLVKYFADTTEEKELAKVLFDVLDTPVSPELLPPKDGKISQKTEDLVGPYELHDFFLYYVLRYGYNPKKVLFLANEAFKGMYDKETILKWLKTFYRRFFSQQFKRSCLPDGPKVGSVAVSPRGDLRMPSDACVRQWLEELE